MCGGGTLDFVHNLKVKSCHAKFGIRGYKYEIIKILPKPKETQNSRVKYMSAQISIETIKQQAIMLKPRNNRRPNTVKSKTNKLHINRYINITKKSSDMS